MSGFRLKPNEFSGFPERQKPFAEPPKSNPGELNLAPRGVPRGSEIVPYNSPANPNRPVLNPFDPRLRELKSPLAGPARDLLERIPTYPGQPLVRRLPIPLPLKLLPELLPLLGLIPELGKLLSPLQNGILGPGATIPLNSEPPFKGGQSPDVLYRFSIYFEEFNGSVWVERLHSEPLKEGPLVGLEPTSTSTSTKIYLIHGNPLVSFHIATSGGLPTRNWRIANVRREDGQPDTGGDPPREALKYPIIVPTSNRKVGTPPFYEPLKNPARDPETGDPPIPITPFPIPIIVTVPGNPYSPPWNPDTGTADPPGELIPGPNKLPVPVPVPDYTFDDPYTPPPTRPDEADPCNNPCNTYLFDLLGYLVDLVEDLARPPEECPELFKMVVPYVECKDNKPETKYGQIEYAFKTPPDLQQRLIDTAILANAGCREDSCVAAVPEWWSVRMGADRPQLVFVYRVQGGRTYHEIAVPHPANTSKTDVPVIPSYQKGNWMYQAQMKDNSKLTFYAASPGEAERVGSALSNLIDPAMRTSPYRYSIVERKNNPVAEAQMFCTAIMYYPVGRKSQMPEWRTRVRV